MPFWPLPDSRSFALNAVASAPPASVDYKPGVVRFRDLFQPHDNEFAQSFTLTTYTFQEDWFVQEISDLQINTSKMVIVMNHLVKPRTSTLQYKTKIPIISSKDGCCHGKMYLIWFPANLRIVVTTANLDKKDWENRVQMVWTQTFPLSTASSGAQQTEFGSRLAMYLQTLGLPNEATRIASVDFSCASVDLITSIPSQVELQDSVPLEMKHGLLQLQHILSTKFTPKSQHSNLLYSFSSVGSVSKEWLNKDFVANLEQHCSPAKNVGSGELKLIWPSVSSVQQSVFGYFGARHCHANRKNLCKPFLMERLFHWQSVPVENQRHFLSHAKLVMRTSIDDQAECEWALLTSCNLSRAAWGETIHFGKRRSVFTIRSFELGVLLMDPKKPITIPFTVPLIKYKLNEVPYSHDCKALEDDWRGVSINIFSKKHAGSS